MLYTTSDQPLDGDASFKELLDSVVGQPKADGSCYTPDELEVHLLLQERYLSCRQTILEWGWGTSPEKCQDVLWKETRHGSSRNEICEVFVMLWDDESFMDEMVVRWGPKHEYDPVTDPMRESERQLELIFEGASR